MQLKTRKVNSPLYGRQDNAKETKENCLNMHAKLDEPSERATSCQSKASQHKEFNIRTSFTFLSILICFVTIFAFPSCCTCTRLSKKAEKWKAECKVQTSAWSDCSKPCDIGLSTRVVSKGRCKLKREPRLCMIRPCDKAYFNAEIKKGKKNCMPLKRSKKREVLKYAGATSEKKYKMKYCGHCRDANKCCTPARSRTRKVWFRRQNGKRFSKKMAFIKKCKCHSNCPSTDNRMVFTIPLDNDMHREKSGQSHALAMDGTATTSKKQNRRRKRQKKLSVDST